MYLLDNRMGVHVFLKMTPILIERVKNKLHVVESLSVYRYVVYVQYVYSYFLLRD